MRKRGLALPISLILVFIATPAFGQASAKVGGDPPFVGLPPPKELEVLEPFVGKWTTTAKVRPSLRQKEEVDAKGEITGTWLHNRHFIRLEGFGKGDKYRLEFTVMMTYDARTSVYRRWTFTSAGLAGQAEGQWDDAAKTMTWKDISAPPNVTGSVKDVLSQDRFETTVFFKTADGQVLADSTTTATRQKQTGK
jgi:hypothetical protein